MLLACAAFKGLTLTCWDSYFGQQDGEFSLVIHSIKAVKLPDMHTNRSWFLACIAKLWDLLPKKP